MHDTQNSLIVLLCLKYIALITLMNDLMPGCDIECLLLNMGSRNLDGTKGLGKRKKDL